MKAGRELDALIASALFNIDVIWTGKTPCDGEPYYTADSENPEGYYLNALSYYSTDIGAAWEVVEKIGLRFCLIKESDNSNERRYKAYFTNGDEGYPVSYAETAAHAICLAALKVVGYEG